MFDIGLLEIIVVLLFFSPIVAIGFFISKAEKRIERDIESTTLIIQKVTDSVQQLHIRLDKDTRKKCPRTCQQETNMRESGTKQIGPEKRPAKIDRALQVMWVLWAIGSIGSLHRVGDIVFRATIGAIEAGILPLVLMVLMFLLVTVMYALLIRAVSRGKNWARVTYGVFASLAIIPIVLNLLSSGFNDKIFIIISLLIVAAYTLVMWILFQRASTDWFRQMSETYNTIKS